MPRGGFGNLIALPLQRAARSRHNTEFLNRDQQPHQDQWAYLASIRRVTRLELDAAVTAASRTDTIIGVRLSAADDADDDPWTRPPSRRHAEPRITDPLPSTVQIVQGNLVYIDKDGLPPALLDRLARLAAFQNPEFYKAQAMRLSTFGKPRVISCSEDLPRHLGLPRGCLGAALDLLERHAVWAKVVDERQPGTLLAVQFSGELTPIQETAAKAILGHDIGVLSAPTAFLDMPVKEVGQIGAGKKRPTGRLDVALIQSLQRKGEVDDIVATYGQVIVDECHHIPAFSFERVLREIKARYVVGLTATPARKDGHHPIVIMQCGPIRHRLGSKEQAASRPFEHVVIPRPTQLNLSPQTEAAGILRAVADGRSPLVLTERTDHLALLAERIGPSVPHLLVMRGGMGVRQRRIVTEALTAIPADQPRVLLATGRYIGEGFDDARLDTLFLAMPVSWRGTIQQYAGRLHRLYATKKVVQIYDYVDSAVPVLARMYKRRLKGYSAIGYAIQP